MHALIRNAAIVLTGPLPYPTWPDPEAGRWWDMRDPAQVAEAGWVEVVTQPRPDDTASTTWERTEPALVNGVPTVDWVERPKRAEELEAEQEQVNEQSIRDKMQTAIASNNTYLGRSNPTNAQVVEQVNRMTRQLNGLLRITGRYLTDVSDT